MYQIRIDGNKELFDKVEKLLLSSGYFWRSEYAKIGSKFGCMVLFHDNKHIDWNESENFGNSAYTNLTEKQFFEIFETGKNNMSGKNRGVVAIDGNEDLYLALQNLFLSKGFNWKCSNDYLDSIQRTQALAKEKYFYFNLETKNIDGVVNPKKLKIYTLDEVFSLFVFKPITIKLNDTYSAVVSKEAIQVGCQTFSHNLIDKLHAASLKARGEI